MLVAARARTSKTTLESSNGLRGMRALYDTPCAILVWSRHTAVLLHAPDDPVEAHRARVVGAAATSRGSRVEVLSLPLRGPALRAAGAGRYRPPGRPPARRGHRWPGREPAGHRGRP